MPDLHDDKDAISDEEFFEDFAAESEPSVARHEELTPTNWYCASCGRPNETLVDLSAGFAQEYVEDCAVCCRPNLITLHIAEDTLIISLHNELEYE